MSLNDGDYKKVVAKTAKEIYEDGAKDTVQETGKVISLLPRLIHASLSKVEKWILNKEYTIKETQKLLEYKLANFDPSKIEPPEAYVAVPAINALSYTYNCNELLDMYANLLASSMIKEKKWDVHPSYVEIIKQLSPDEAKLLKHIASQKCENEFPLINIVMEKEMKDHTEEYIVVKNYSDIGIGVCDLPENISRYIDNLARLNLIEIRELSKTSNFDYSKIENSNYVNEFKSKTKLKDGFYWSFDEFMFMITSFGKSFISICVLDPKDSSDE